MGQTVQSDMTKNQRRLTKKKPAETGETEPGHGTDGKTVVDVKEAATTQVVRVSLTSATFTTVRWNVHGSFVVVL